MALALLAGTASAAHATGYMYISEVLARWGTNDAAEFVELLFWQADNENVADGTYGSDQLLIFDHTGALARKAITFDPVTSTTEGSHILVASPTAVALGLVPEPDVPPTDLQLDTLGGRVCYIDRHSTPLPTCAADCLTYGRWDGGDTPYSCTNPVGRSLYNDLVPDNRVIAGRHASNAPSPTNNAGEMRHPQPTCGNDTLDSWEQCDGALLGEATCAPDEVGAPVCDEWCRLDRTACTRCGNGVVDEGEACDDALGDAACLPPDTDPAHHRTCQACSWSDLQCDVCGNGRIDDDRGEQCEGGVGTATCRSLGRLDGDLHCGPQCTFEGCSESVLVSGGKERTDCLAELAVRSRGEPVPVRPAGFIACHDGDEGCDGDSRVGWCGFDVRLCLRVADPRLRRCRPRPLDRLVVAAKPRVMTLVASAVTDAVVTERRPRRTTFVPTADAGEQCYPATRVAVRAGRPVVVRTNVRAADTPRRRDVDAIKLFCRVGP